MEEQDVISMRKVEDQLRLICTALQSPDLSPGTQRFTVDMYSIVYAAATRSRIGDVDNQYAAPQELYLRFQELMAEAVNMNPIDGRLPPQQVAAALLRKWSQFLVVQRWMLKTFGYLSRFYILHNNKTALDVLSLQIFYTVFRQHAAALAKVLLERFKAERRGEAVNKEELRQGVELFFRMSGIEDGDELQINLFSTPFLKETREFYQAESTRWIAESTVPEYLDMANKWLEEEAARAQRLLPPPMQTALMSNIEQELIANHLNSIIQAPTGFASMLKDWRTDYIRKTVAVVARLKNAGLDPLAAVVVDCCRQEGMAIVRKYSGQPDVDSKAYVHDLIDLHEKHMALLNNELGNHAAFQIAIKDAFEVVVNAGVATSESGPGATASTCELLANYVDSVLRTGTEKATDDELDDIFTKVVSLFTRIVDKDLFQEFLRKQLSRRLLTSTAFNEECEKNFIVKLKTTRGASYTSKLEGMINDKGLSQSTSNAFSEHLAELAKTPEASSLPSLDFTCQVLTTGFWPPLPQDSAVLPTQIQNIVSIFTNFYEKHTSKNRVLTWVNGLGSVTITAAFPKGSKELTMSVYQGIILMLFNSTAEMTLDHVKNVTGIEWEEVKRAVQSFTHSRVKVLIRSGEGAYQPTETITVNDGFSSAQKKMKLPVAVQRTAAAVAAVHAAVEEDRRPAIDACCMRVMKSRRKLDHGQLVAQVMEQLQARFAPDPKLIKQRIEDLINRDYIERDPANPSTYIYVA